MKNKKKNYAYLHIPSSVFFTESQQRLKGFLNMCLGAKLDPQITDKEIKFTTFAFASYSTWKESFASILYTLIAKQIHVIFYFMCLQYLVCYNFQFKKVLYSLLNQYC